MAITLDAVDAVFDDFVYFVDDDLNTSSSSSTPTSEFPTADDDNFDLASAHDAETPYRYCLRNNGFLARTMQTKRTLTPKDFEFLKLIGRGTFGRVYQVRKRDTRRIYAMKVLSKKEIIAKKEIAHTIGERKILQTSLHSPFLVGLKFSFQTDTDLYLVTDFKSGGELFWHLQKETKFPEERARFYIAELVLALEHLHKYDIVYRCVVEFLVYVIFYLV